MSLWHLIRYGAFDHDLQNGRDPLGRLTQRCSACGFTRLVLCEDVNTKGPAHSQAPDLGARTTKAKKVKAGNVREFARESQR